MTLRTHTLCCVCLSAVLLQGGCGNNEWFAKNTTKSWEKEKPPAEKDNHILTAQERPATAKTMYAYSRVLAAQRKDAACDSLLTKVIELSPRQKEAYLLQAEVRVRMRHGSEAIQSLRTALRYFPHDPVILNNLGMCLLMKSECSAALACFTEAAAVEPSNARYRANMATSLGLLGRDEESSSLYKMVVSDEDTVHNVAVLNSARTERLGHPVKTNAPSPAPAAPPAPEETTPPTQTSEATDLTEAPAAVAVDNNAAEPAPEPVAVGEEVPAALVAQENPRQGNPPQESSLPQAPVEVAAQGPEQVPAPVLTAALAIGPAQVEAPVPEPVTEAYVISTSELSPDQASIIPVLLLAQN
jgi:Tfp pilus assembly protein PilF